jgi:hypothetical protein
LSAELAKARISDQRDAARAGQQVESEQTKSLEAQLAIQESNIKASQDRIKANRIETGLEIQGINNVFAAEENAKRKEEADKRSKEAADRAKADAEAIAKAERDTFNALRQETAALQIDFDKQVAEERKKNEAKLQVELADLADTSLQTQLDTRIAFLQRLEIEEGTSLDRRINIIELEAKKRQDNIRNTVDDTAKANALILLDEEQTQEAIRAERKKSTEEAINDALEIAQATADVFGKIIELQGAQSAVRIEQINAASQAEKEAIESTTLSEENKQRKLEALRIRTEQKIAAERRKQAAAEKALAIFNTIINTAAAVMKAGGPLTPIGALTALAGVAQIAIISSTPIPKFKKGGPVGGRSHEAGGTLIEAERGEYVVNKSSVARHRQALDAMNTSSAAFRKFIDEKYVRPAIAGYAMNSKRDGITVNASLNSKSMERELKGLRKDMRNKNTVINFNGSDSRYSWQQN